MTQFRIEGDFFAVLSTALNHAIIMAAQQRNTPWQTIVQALETALSALASMKE